MLCVPLVADDDLSGIVVDIVLSRIVVVRVKDKAMMTLDQERASVRFARLSA